MKLLDILQIVIAVLLIIAVSFQSRGGGLSSVFGGGGSSFQTKRGAEKTIFTVTIVLSILFFVISLAHIFI
jgi:preprotein translocase subunit SecG